MYVLHHMYACIFLWFMSNKLKLNWFGVVFYTSLWISDPTEAGFTNLEQTPLNRCLQLPAPYKRLIDNNNETDKQ